MGLPVKVEFHDDEAPLSFASRLAAANGYSSMDRMLRLMGLQSRKVQSGDAGAMEALAHWSGENTEARLRYPGLMSQKTKTRKFGSATLLGITRSGSADDVRCCAECVAGDMKRAGREVARPYIRSWWLIPEIENCPLHNRTLVSLPLLKNASVGDIARRVETFIVRQNDVSSLSTDVVDSQLDAYVLRCIRGENQGGFLDHIEAHIAVGFCEHLGSDLVKLSPEPKGGISAREVGYRVASRGHKSIVETMGEIYRRKTEVGNGDGRGKGKGYQALFPSVKSWLKTKIGNPEYEIVLDVVREATARNTPIGPGDNFMGGVKKRYLHSVESASKEFGIHRKRVRAILTEARILEKAAHRNNALASFDASLAEPLLRAAISSVPASEAAEMLGVAPQRVKKLSDSGLLPSVEGEMNYRRAFVRIKRSDVEDLLSRLEETAQCVTEIGNLLPIAIAARKTALHVPTLVTMILAGRLKRIFYVGSVCNIGTLLLDHEELMSELKTGGREIVAVTPEQLLSLREAEKRLRVCAGTAAALIKHGFLAVVERREHTRGYRLNGIASKSLDQFEASYISSHQLAKVHGTHARIMRAHLESLGIQPIYKTVGTQGAFFRHADVANMELGVVR